jgi:hypothetical protein
MEGSRPDPQHFSPHVASSEDIPGVESGHNAAFPDISGDVSVRPPLDLQALSDYFVSTAQTSRSFASSVQYLYSGFCHGGTFELTGNCGVDVLPIFCCFLDFLFTRQGEVGPFLIITTEDESARWASQLHQIENLTAICFTGTPEARQALRETRFADGSKLRFHVLLTTVDVVETDSDLLNQIHFRIVVQDNVAVPVSCQSGSELRLVREKLEKSADLLRDLASCLLESSVCSSLDRSTQEGLAALHSTCMGLVGKTGVSPVTTGRADRWVDCRLTAFQRAVVKRVVSEYDRTRGLIPLCHTLRRLCSHPLLTRGIHESDFLASSSKLQVLDVIMTECVNSGQKIVFVSDFVRMTDLIEDLVCLRKHQCDVIRSGSDSPQYQVLVYSPHHCPFPSSIGEVDTVVVVDGDGSVPVKSRRVVHLVCTEFNERVLNGICTSKKATESAKCERICRACAIAAFVVKPERSPREALSAATVDAPKTVPSAMERELADVDIWNVMRKARKLSRLEERKIDDGEWSERDRDELVRWLFRFGWNRWDAIIDSSEIEKSEAEVVRASRALLRYMVRVASSADLSFALIRDFIRERTTGDDATLDQRFINLSEFANYWFRERLDQQAKDLLKRLELLHYVGKAVESAKCSADLIEMPRALGISP